MSGFSESRGGEISRSTTGGRQAAGRGARSSIEAGTDDAQPRSARLGRGDADAPSRTRELLARLSREIGEPHFQRYFDGQTRVSVAGAHVDVTVPSEYLARLINRRFGEQIRKAARAGTAGGREPIIDDSPDVEVRYRVDRTAFGDAPRPAAPPVSEEEATPRAFGRATPLNPPSSPAATPAVKPAATPTASFSASAAVPTYSPRPVQATTRHRFEDFVVGASNKLAYNAALRMAEDPQAAGVLFVHGLCGMGKTHLLQSVATRFLERNPGANVRYISAEAFTNDYISAVKANRIDGFRKMYRRVDLLCLDDVHFLTNKDATQTELLHTFDAIGMEGARVVLASDDHPREILKLNERLRSRFMGGAVVRIDPPDGELRARLVTHLARRRGLALEEGAVQLIAERSARSMGTLGGFGGSVREIDGLLIQVDAVHRLLPEMSGGTAIGAILVRKALGISDGDTPTDATPRVRRPIAIQTVTSEVCRGLSVDITELMGSGRHKRVVLARAICVNLARKLTTHSYPEIARGMGRPNHSTVITAHKRLQDQLSGLLPVEPESLVGISPELRTLSLSELIAELGRRTVNAAS